MGYYLPERDNITQIIAVGKKIGYSLDNLIDVFFIKGGDFLWTRKDWFCQVT